MRQQGRARTLPSHLDELPLGVPSEATSAIPATLNAKSSGGNPEPERATSSLPVRHISVKPGDTLWSLAKRYGVSLHELRSLNHLTGSLIMVGQALRVPGVVGQPGSVGDRIGSNP